MIWRKACFLGMAIVAGALMRGIVADVVGQNAMGSVVRILYSTPSSVTLGEPVIVQFVISNGLKESIKGDLGWRRRNAFRLAIINAQSERTDLPPLWEEGISEIGTFVIKAQESYPSEFVLNEWYEFDKPGKYQIEIDLPTPIRNESGTTIQAETRGLLNIEVKPADKDSLRRTCEELAKKVDNDDPDASDARIDAAVALSHVRDPIVIPVVSRLLGESPLFGLNFIWGLSRIATDEAIEAILTAAKSADVSTARYAKTVLKQMRDNVKNPRLKDEIDAVIREEKGYGVIPPSGSAKVQVLS